MGQFHDVVHSVLADEAATATALREEAAEHERHGNQVRAAACRAAAADAETRADTWRPLLRLS